MLNNMFQPKTVIRFTQIVPKLLHIFDTNKSCVHQVFNFVDDKIVDKI
jgi:hypothetical protein